MRFSASGWDLWESLIHSFLIDPEQLFFTRQTDKPGTIVIHFPISAKAHEYFTRAIPTCQFDPPSKRPNITWRRRLFKMPPFISNNKQLSKLENLYFNGNAQMIGFKWGPLLPGCLILSRQCVDILMKHGWLSKYSHGMISRHDMLFPNARMVGFSPSCLLRRGLLLTFWGKVENVEREGTECRWSQAQPWMGAANLRWQKSSSSSF